MTGPGYLIMDQVPVTALPHKDRLSGPGTWLGFDIWPHTLSRASRLASGKAAGSLKIKYF